MDLQESIQVEAPVGAVWSMLRDPRIVAECFPGAELRSSEGDAHDGRIVVKFGPTTVAFQGRAEIEFDDAIRSVTITARGRDSRGATRASAKVVANVNEEGAGRTRVSVTGDVDVVGPLAQFARAGGIFVTRQLLRDFGECIGARAIRAMGHASDVAEAPAVAGAAPNTQPGTIALATKPVSAFSVLWQSLAAWVRDWVGGRSQRGRSR